MTAVTRDWAQLDLPMPGDAFEGRTVIASVWGCDFEKPYLATVMLLNPAPPFYTVAQLVAYDDETWKLGAHEDHRNINYATEDYAQMGGDV